MNKIKIKKIATAAVFSAVIAACAWVYIPTPFGINLTFSLFAVCLTAFCLDIKSAFAATAVYITLGAIGLPVFSQFSGGIGVLFGVSGGFLWGFLLTVVVCGVAKNNLKKTIKYLLMVFSVLLCHTVGVIQYSIVSGNDFLISFLTASLPFLIKDIILVFLAELIAKKVKI